ncbi:hypothetical protein FO519_003903 [Halicephalobus sp. NKZ332]|nr:hypothetical protein FO519_003903 [Halicephalobus sp. NKZ332]
MGSGNPLASVTNPTPNLPWFFGTTARNVNSPTTISSATQTFNPSSPIMTSPNPLGVMSSTTASIQVDDKIIYVATLWRHGERYPEDFFPGDINESGNFSQGEMTLNGMNELFELGIQLRNRYVDFLKLVSPRYNPKEIYVRSTDLNRTLISAQSVLAGFYSSGGIPGVDFPAISGWPTNFTPVPVHSDPQDDDIILPFYSNCSRKNELWEMLKSSTYYNEILNESSFYLEEINNQTGENFDLLGALGVMNNIILENALRLPIVPWANSLVGEFGRVFAEYMGSLLGFGEVESNSTSKIDVQKELSILLSGAFLNFFTDKIVQKTNCEVSNFTDDYCGIMRNQKFFGFSGSDIALMALFKGLGFNETNGDENKIPDFGSCILMELWQKNDFDENSNNSMTGHYLRIYYMKDPLVGTLTDLGTVLGCPEGKCMMDFVSQKAEEIRPNPENSELCDFGNPEFLKDKVSV